MDREQRTFSFQSLNMSEEVPTPCGPCLESDGGGKGKVPSPDTFTCSSMSGVHGDNETAVRDGESVPGRCGDIRVDCGVPVLS